MSHKEIAALENRPDATGAQIQSLAAQLYRERVAEARTMPPEEKLLAGEELFDYACAITLAGTRNQFPGINEEECRRILEERLELRERMEKRG
jgi:hypothetical protein